MGVGGVVFDVAAETDDEVVDGASVGVFVDAPDLFEDLLAGDDLAFVLGEVAEEVGFHQGEMSDAIGGDELEGVEADGAVVEEVLVGLIGQGGGRCLWGCGDIQVSVNRNQQPPFPPLRFTVLPGAR